MWRCLSVYVEVCATVCACVCEGEVGEVCVW